MTINSNDTITVPVTSYKGIDGSNSIPNIPEGYCIDLENADLSEAGLIKKRSGYVKAYGDLPCKFVYEKTATTLAYSTLTNRVLNVTIKPYDATGLAYLDAELGYQSERDLTLTTNLVIVTIVNSSSGGSQMLEDFESYISKRNSLDREAGVATNSDLPGGTRHGSHEFNGS